MATDAARRGTASSRDAGQGEVEALDDFLADASRQESRVEHLLADPPKSASKANVAWSADLDDPEFHKNVRIFRRLIAGAVGLCERARTRRGDVVHRLDELRRRVILPNDKPLSLSVLLAHRFALEQLLAELGDELYLRTRAAELYAEADSTHATWRTMFKVKPPLFVDGEQSPGPSAIEDTRAMLVQLLAAKEAQDLPIRARRELKQRVLLRYALPLVAFAGLVLGLAVYVSQGATIVLPVTAALAGAALGRLMNLRDDVTRGSQVREFVPLFLAQLAVGLITGLVVVLVTGLPIINLGPNGIAAFGFAAGFSEATFRGLVSRIAGEPSGEPIPKPESDTPPRK